MNIVRRRAVESAEYNIWIDLPGPHIWQPYLERLHKINPKSLPLYGIPFAIKDNIDLDRVTTTAGCPDYAYEPAQSAYAVELLIAAGAIPVGKTNLDQFATGLVGTRSPYGETHNSVNSDFISGGSSSGSAVAVAMGQASFALGTDTAGSGRVPAAFNQLLGLKPSKGLVSTRGIVPACRTQDCVSVFASGVEDLATVLQCLLLEDDQQPSSFQLNRERESLADQLVSPAHAEESFTVGIPRQKQLGFFGHGNYAARFARVTEYIEAAGGQCREIHAEPFLDAATLLYEGPWVTERYMVVADELENSPDALLPEIRKVIQGGRALSAADMFTALYRLQELKAAADRQLSGVDCILMPTTGGIFTIDEVRENPIQLNSELGRYTNFMNLLDYAAIALPADNPNSGLPFGITLFGLRGTEATLLQIARRYLSQNSIVMPAAGTAGLNSLKQVSGV